MTIEKEPPSLPLADPLSELAKPDLETMHKRCCEVSRWFDTNYRFYTWSMYIPTVLEIEVPPSGDAYIPRPELDTPYADFLQSDYPLMIIKGGLGTGKSTWAIKLAHEANQVPGQTLVLPYHSLVFGHNIAVEPDSNLAQYDNWSSRAWVNIFDDLGFARGSQGPLDIPKTLEELNQFLRQNNTTLVVLFDAVEHFPSYKLPGSNLNDSLRDFFLNFNVMGRDLIYQNFQNIKLVAVCQQSEWHSDYSAAKILLTPLYFKPPVKPGSSCAFSLNNMTDEQIAQITCRQCKVMQKDYKRFALEPLILSSDEMGQIVRISAGNPLMAVLAAKYGPQTILPNIVKFRQKVIGEYGSDKPYKPPEVIELLFSLLQKYQTFSSESGVPSTNLPSTGRDGDCLNLLGKIGLIKLIVARDPYPQLLTQIEPPSLAEYLQKNVHESDS